jgi:hypothetical protein
MIMKKIFFLFAMVLLGTAVSAQSTVPIGYKDLPKDSQKYITEHYSGYAVGIVTEGRRTNGKPQYYDVHVTKGAEKLLIIFDKDGDFVKQMADWSTPSPSKPMPDTSQKKGI